jgi:AmmeMemoRadiSam system protein B
MSTIQTVRPSPIAGSWYPGTEKELRSQVSEFLKLATPPQVPGELLGLISPHAGYIYSGPTAAYSYRLVQGKSYDTVVIASPLHEYLPYPFLTTAHESYATPLGEVPVATDLIEKMIATMGKSIGSNLIAVANDREHSLEIQLPFLQVALASPFRLLPLMVRENNAMSLKTFGETLASVVQGQNVLLVASTDLSHFYSEKQAEKLDEHMMKQFAAFSPEGVLQAEAEQSGFACGSGAVAVILWATRALGGRQVTLLHHSTSADTTHDNSNVVGYGAAAISK